MDYENVFKDSYDRTVESPAGDTDFFVAFYDNFLNQSEFIKAKFANTNMRKQQQMLKKSFFSLLTFYASNNADHILEKIAKLHDRQHHDIQPELYDLWLESLIDTVRCCDPVCNRDIELSWRLIMAPGISYMKFHY